MPYWMLVVKPRNFVREDFQVVPLMQQSSPPVPDKKCNFPFDVSSTASSGEVCHNPFTTATKIYI